ncbi:hypothetical protein [Glycomyces tarimensis]
MPNATLAGRRHAFGIGLTAEALKYFAFWIAAVVIGALVLPAIVAQTRSIEISAWYFAANSGNIFTAIVAGTFLAALLPTMIAQGLTRRELATSMGWFGLLWSLALGALTAAVFLAEHAVYEAFDWNQSIQGEPGDLALESVGDVIVFAAPYPLTYLLYFTAGALIGAASYRWDAGWLIIVPAVPITLALDDAISSAEPWGPGWLRVVTSVTDDMGTWSSVVAILAAVAVGAWICRRILIDTPIRAKRG